MDYSDLLKILRASQISVKELADSLDMTSSGFKTSIDRGTFPIKKVKQLCEFLCISIPQFFGVEESVETYNNSTSQKAFGNKAKNIIFDSKATETLIEQLRIKDEQIKEKDSQIAKLFSMLPN